MRYAFLALALFALLPGCQSPGEKKNAAPSPLRERIWDVTGKKFIEAPELLARLNAVDYVLLGEVHDNAVHHQHQAEILKALRPQAAVLEHLTEEQATDFNQHQKRKSPQPLQSLLKWEKSGWPAFEIFSPVFEALSQTTVVGGALDKKMLARVRRGKDGPIPHQQAKRLGANVPRPEWDNKLGEILKEAHCGHMPGRMLPWMLRVQKYKDLYMAWRLSQHPKAVLLAGAGHTRKEGVPYYLAQTKKRVAAVAFTEAAEGRENPADYDGGADYLWFTEQAHRPDPCAAFKRRRHVVIDPGHSPESPGVRSATGRPEVTYNDRFAALLEKRLKQEAGVRVLLSRTAQESFSLKDRIERLKSLAPDLVVSIHHDSMQERYLERRADGGWKTRTPAEGFSLFVGTKGPLGATSRRLAEALADALLSLGRKPTLHHAENIPGEGRKLLDSDRGIYEFNDLAIVKHAVAPTVLLELGLIVDEADERFLADPDNQQRMAEALGAAILRFAL